MNYFSRNQKIAIKNFYDMLKPGGILIIDHRNYDYILKHGKSPNKNIYYNSSIYKVVTKTIYEDGKAKQIILDYRKKGEEDGNFLLHVQPYKLSEFSSLLKVSGEKDCFRLKASRVSKSENFPVSKIFVAKTFRIKRLNRANF